jgi:hypothetical protein
MARKGGKARCIVEKPTGSGKWWVRLYVNGREQRHRCDNKTQAKNLYERLKVEQREGRLFPERYRARHQPYRQAMDRSLLGRINQPRQQTRKTACEILGRSLGPRPLSGITSEDLRHQQAKMVDSGDFQPATIGIPARLNPSRSGWQAESKPHERGKVPSRTSEGSFF